MDTLPDIHQLADAETLRLAGDPNIVTVGYGSKTTAGQMQPNLCLIYFVRKKTTDPVSLNSWPIPAEVQGYPTDVVIWDNPVPGKEDRGFPTGDRGSRKENPLVGGTSTTSIGGFDSFPHGYGTLGGLCVDNATGSIAALSNAHVWGFDVGRDVIQPWLPLSNYFEAGLKLLLCGSLAYPLEWTAPSGLTVTLEVAAVAAFAAALLSDAEDPSRFGQRMTAVPATALTIDENIQARAETVPDLPFAGRAYSARTTWNYARRTTDSVLTQSILADRPNEHYLRGKRLWSDGRSYSHGQTIHLCAEVADADLLPRPRFVVGHFFPLSSPETVLRRVLRPAPRPFPPPSDIICFLGFPPPAAAGKSATLPLRVGDVTIDALGDAPFFQGGPAGVPADAVVLTTRGEFRIFVPSSTTVELMVFHLTEGSGFTARAFNAAGQVIAFAIEPPTAGELHTLSLSAMEIISVTLTSYTGAFLAGVCYSARALVNEPAGQTYVGELVVGEDLPAGKWGGCLFVQSVDDTPLASHDPIAAARKLSGITTSANLAVIAPCLLVEILDHTFDIL